MQISHAGSFAQEPVDITFWMLIPSQAASMVIGRGGSHVKWIREKLGAYVKINEAEGEAPRLSWLVHAVMRLQPLMGDGNARRAYC